MAEWSIAPVLKTGESQGSVGSNPTPSALPSWLEKVMEIMTTYEMWQIGIGVSGVAAVTVAAILAYIVGINQSEINSRLLQLQDYVSISVAPNSNNTIALWNTGGSNLYMWGFDMPNNNQRFEKPRLVSKSTVANYWIPAPDLGKISTTTTFEFKLYLTDEYGNKWISENGGEASLTQVEKEGKKVDAAIIKVWSYKTSKTNWEFN
jgi:hypothetical protein